MSHILSSRRLYGLIILFLILSSFHPNSPYDAVDNIYARSKGRLSYEGMLFMKQNFIPHIEPCRPIPKDGGGLWACVYQDGLIVYNCFRRCRGTIEAATLFLGLGENEDCDSFVVVNGKPQQVCYPKMARDLYRYHGQVIKIQRIRSCM